jgi:hypothetical protein
MQPPFIVDVVDEARQVGDDVLEGLVSCKPIAFLVLESVGKSHAEESGGFLRAEFYSGR